MLRLILRFTEFMAKNWCNKTPRSFRFAAKFPSIITHQKRLKDVDRQAIGPLSDKTLALLIQLPPSLQIFEGLAGLREVVRKLDCRFRYAVEARHSSWFQDLAYSFFCKQ